MFCISSVNFSVCSTSIKLSMLVKSILTQSPVALWAISYIIVDLVFSSITSYIVGYQLHDSGFSFSSITSYMIVDSVFSSITSYIVGYQLYDSGFSF